MRRAKRYVSVDMGYGLQENWYHVRVIGSRTVDTLFSGPQEELLVELPGGERKWVSYWTEIQKPELKEVK